MRDINRIHLPAFILHAAALLAAMAAVLPVSAAQPVSFTARYLPGHPRPGEAVRIEIEAAIAPGWHLYSLAASAAPGPSPTSITLGVSATTRLTKIAVAEDQPIVTDDPNFNETVAYHLRRARFTLAGRLSQGSKSGVLPVVIHYQTCSAKFCLPPTDLILPLRITVGSGLPRAAYAKLPVLAPIVKLSSQPTKRSAIAALPGTAALPGGLGGFLLAAFGAGLLALLTPCVFPLIPVTFGFFTKQIGDGAQQQIRRRLIGLASVYASGIIISFTALGLIAALLLGAAGASRIAANPWFNLFFGLLFVIFAFSFFETFSLTLPQTLMRFVQPSAASAGVAGVLMMGLAFVFAAFTCTAPFIGTVLVAAASASNADAWLRPLLGMIVFSLALALPFFALALFPGLLTKLPRSGGWLTRFKAALGFVELAYALTYFSKADLVWQAHLLTRPVFLAIWTLIAAAGALYLLGILRVSPYADEAHSRIGVGRALFAGLFAAAALICVYALTGRPVGAALAAYLPPAAYGERGTGALSAGGALDSDSAWMTSLGDALALARRNGKPVFVDFTGYTCTNCRYVELNTFTKEPVTGLLEGSFNRVRLYTDGGPDALRNQAEQQRLVGSVALPFYAIVSPAGSLVASDGGSGASVAQFADFLRSGLSQAPASPPDAALWSPYTAARIAAARRSGKPVIIDFTASWCTNCHAIEKDVFTAPPVVARLPKFATLRMDLTDFYGPENASIESRYNVLALPAVVFLGSSGKEVPGTRVTGLVSPAQFLAHMRSAEAAS